MEGAQPAGPVVLQCPPSPNSRPPPEAAAHSEPRTSQGLGPSRTFCGRNHIPSLQLGAA